MEELFEKYKQIEIKYGSTTKEKHAKTVQGVPGKVESKSSKHVDISYVKRGKKWAAEIRHMKKRYYLRLHESEEDATRVYDVNVVELYDENVKINFPK